MTRFDHLASNYGDARRVVPTSCPRSQVASRQCTTIFTDVQSYPHFLIFPSPHRHHDAVPCIPVVSPSSRSPSANSVYPVWVTAQSETALQNSFASSFLPLLLRFLHQPLSTDRCAYRFYSLLFSAGVTARQYRRCHHASDDNEAA